MVRGLRRSFVVLFLVAGSCVGVTNAASAADVDVDQCTFATLTMPARVVVSTPSRTVGASLQTDCFNAAVWGSPVMVAFAARWDAIAEDGRAQVSSLWTTQGSEPAIWDDPPAEIRDTMHLGGWSWRPVSGFSTIVPGEETTVLTLDEMSNPVTDVRVASVNYVAADRIGARVTVTTRAYRYWTSTHGYGVWSGALGVIQYRAPGETTWHGLKYIYSDNAGRYAYTYTTSAAREYRAVTWDGRYIWGAPSANTAFR